MSKFYTVRYTIVRVDILWLISLKHTLSYKYFLEINYSYEYKILNWTCYSYIETDSWKRIEESIIHPLSENEEDFKKFSFICGAIFTNAFEISGADAKNGALIGIFSEASLMNHHCVGNTRLIPLWTKEKKPKLRILASVDITKGTFVWIIVYYNIYSS